MQLHKRDEVRFLCRSVAGSVKHTRFHETCGSISLSFHSLIRIFFSLFYLDLVIVLGCNSQLDEHNRELNGLSVFYVKTKEEN